MRRARLFRDVGTCSGLLYLGDWFDKANAVISSFNLGQTVTEIIPVVLSASQKRSLLFLVKLDKNSHKLWTPQMYDFDYLIWNYSTIKFDLSHDNYVIAPFMLIIPQWLCFSKRKNRISRISALWRIFFFLQAYVEPVNN